MDLDLAEYDQVDEVKYFVGQNYGGPSSLMITISSGSEPGANDDPNCENDFVLLPPVSPQTQSIEQNLQHYQQPTRSQQQQQQGERNCLKKAGEFKLPLEMANDAAVFYGAKQASDPAKMSSNVSKNPFSYRKTDIHSDTIQQPQQPNWVKALAEDFVAKKPVGLLELAANELTGDPSHLSRLMHEIVARSDSIFIAIPCAFCHETISCPPSDITLWLNHMSNQHNCKLCPMCNKLVGLGPHRDIEIMREHVVSHIDNDWLDKRATKVNFTYGLQQHWYSEIRCNVKEISKSCGYFKN